MPSVPQAFMYDALTHAATPIADMLCIRHGCGGARIGEKVYIVGGEYADSRPTRSFCRLAAPPFPSADSFIQGSHDGIMRPSSENTALTHSLPSAHPSPPSHLSSP